MAEPLTELPVDFLCRVEFDTSSTPVVFIRGGPEGTRVRVSATSGRFEGPRLRGEVVPPGGDWATAAADGSSRVDGRTLWRTDDGAEIVVTYNGVGVTGNDSCKLRTAPRFQTGDDRYAWLNLVQAVGRGRMEPPGVVYDLYTLH